MFKVLIVGCGKIAGGFDSAIKKNFPLTHAGSFSKDSRFVISGCVDPKHSKRNNFMKYWGIQEGFKSINDVLKLKKNYDVISICSPTSEHFNNIKVAIKLKPKIIFCEKPISNSLSLAEEIVNVCKKENIKLVVNYNRRWDDDVINLYNDIRSKKWGKIISVIGIYNKGILNNCSHMIDLFHYLIGPLDIISIGPSVYDFNLDDPTVPLHLKGRNNESIHIACGDANYYSIYEFKILFSNGSVDMEDGGFFWKEKKVIKSVIFDGYKTLDDGIRKEGHYKKCMINAINNIYNFLTKKEKILSTGESAILTHRLCDKIITLVNINKEREYEGRK